MDRVTKLRAEDKVETLEVQGYRCIYCNIPFGSIVYRGGLELGYLELVPEFDHFDPVAWEDRGVGNIVAACQVCNRLKGSNRFGSLLSAQIHTMQKWISKGYRLRCTERQIDCWECSVLSYGPYNLLQGPVIQNVSYMTRFINMMHDDPDGAPPKLTWRDVLEWT